MCVEKESAVSKSEMKRKACQRGIHPLSNWVLIALEPEQETTSDGGIVLPESVSVGSDRTKFGQVMAFGPHCKANFEIGDVVVLDSYDQKACEIDDTTIMVREENILAVKR
jgi:co-chaperonin GroES (HSP10)